MRAKLPSMMSLAALACSPVGGSPVGPPSPSPPVPEQDASPPSLLTATPDAASDAGASDPADAGPAPLPEPPPDWFARHGVDVQAGQSTPVLCRSFWTIEGVGEAAECVVLRDAPRGEGNPGWPFTAYARIYVATGASSRAVLALERATQVVTDTGKAAGLGLFVSDEGREVVLGLLGGRCLDYATRVQESGGARAGAVVARVRAVCSNEGRYVWRGGAYVRQGPAGDVSGMRYGY